MKVISAFAIMPFASAVGANDKVVDFISWTPGQNIALCKGDCDTDAECANSEYGVKCIHETHEDRKGGTIPGCSGMTHSFDSSTDYCYCPSGTNCDPNTPPPTPAPTYVNEGEYTEDNFECHPSNCNDWDCATWCKCFSDEDEETGAYEQAGCVDDGDESCKCVSNVYDVHEFPENWKLGAGSMFVPNERYPTQLHDVLALGPNVNFVKRFETGFTHAGSHQGAWDIQNDFCTKQGGRLPTFEEVCPNGIGGQPAAGCTGDHSWVPYSKDKHSWAYVGCDGHEGIVCKDHVPYHGNPNWGSGDIYGIDTDCTFEGGLDGGLATTVKTFHRPLRVRVDMKQDKDGPNFGTPECGVLQVFPQNGDRHTGYNAGINWWTNRFGAGVDHDISGYGPILTANQSSINEFNLFQRVEIELDEDGQVRYYLNGELRHEVHDNSLQSGTISVGKGCRNYRYKDLRVSKGSKDGNVPTNPDKRTNAYQEKWGQIYATQWDN
jgi:hypothetical protein